MTHGDLRLETMTEADIEEVAELERRTFPSPWTRDAFPLRPVRIPPAWRPAPLLR